MNRLRIYATIICCCFIYAVQAQMAVQWDIVDDLTKKSSSAARAGQEGYLKFTVDLEDIDNHFYIVGYGAELELSDVSQMNYGLFIRYSDLYIMENGRMVRYCGRLEPNETLEIRLVEHDIFYIRNGEEMYSSSIEGHDELFPMGQSFREVDIIPNVEREGETAPPPPPPAEGRHWTNTRVFDGNGTADANVVSEARTYYDNLGRVQQVQSKYFTQNQVLATQPVYDAYGRAVGQTLVAPTGQTDIQFKDNFLLNENGQNYSYKDFDDPFAANSTASGGYLNPKPVGEQANTVGWYYSDNNTLEEYVADSDYPFSTYKSSPDGSFTMAGGVGKHHKMGSGNEYKSFSLSPSTELEYLYGYHRSYEVEDDGTTLDPVSKINARKFRAYKQITIGENGEEFVSFYSLTGQLLATAVSNAPTGANNCPQTQIAKYTMYGKADRAANVHIPNGKKGTVEIEFTDFVVPSELDLKIVKLEGYQLLTEGLHYNITTLGQHDNTNTGAVGYKKFKIQFTSLESQGSGFYKFSYDINSVNPGGSVNPRPTHGYITCETEYSNWTLHYYNRYGQLMKSIAPNGIKCDFDPTTISVNNATITANDFSNWTSTKDLLTIPVPVLTGSYTGRSIKLDIASANGLEMEKNQNAVIHNPNNCIGAVIGLDPSGREVRTPSFSFKEDIVVYGESGGVLTEIDRYAVTKDIYRENIYDVYGNLSRYLFRMDELFEERNYIFKENVLSNYDNIIVRVEDIKVKYCGSTIASGYKDYDPTDAYESFYFEAILQLSIGGSHSVYQAQEIPHDYANTYHYDVSGLLLAEQDPDRGLVEYIYDDEYKLRFSQDAQQRLDDKYSYIIYDKRSRVVETGEYDETRFNDTPFPEHYYLDILTVANASHTNAYQIRNDDIGALLPVGTRLNRSYISYDETDVAGGVVHTGYQQTYVGGRVAKTWNDHNTTYYSYNHKGQLVFSVQNIQNGIGKKTMDYEYDFFGRLLKKTYEKGDAEEFAHIYTYDRDGQLVRVETDNGTVVKHTEYDYYTHGALKRTELGNNLQGLDYVYTITGALKSINHPFINRTTAGQNDSYNSAPYDPGQDGYAGENSSFARDVFGMAIDYYEEDYERTNTNINTGAEMIESLGVTSLPQEHYDGRIKSIRWNTEGSNNATGDAQNMWLYDYDWKGQLKQATSGTFQFRQGSQQWTFTESNDYKLHGITYDDNGNILTLKRNDKDGLLMDDLVYKYETVANGYSANTNKLRYVQDAVGLKNYDDVAAQIQNNYQYDKNGGIAIDKEKGIAVDYHSNGKVEFIYQEGTTILKASYTYNERGERLTKSAHDASGVITKTTYYVREVSGAVVSIYEKDVAGTNTIEQTEVPVASVGMYYVKQDNYVYQITDHLGNVRATISDTKVSGSAVVLSYADYYPFGMTMAGRNMTTAPEYRLAYQGQEIDKEVGGAGFYAFELRHYDARLGKWLSADPYEQHWSPYLAMSNNPISFIDPDGGWSVFTYQQEYLQAQAEYMWNNMPAYSASTNNPWFISNDYYTTHTRTMYKYHDDPLCGDCVHAEITSNLVWAEHHSLYDVSPEPLKQKYKNHVVVAGDTPYDLAAFYQTDVWAIARLNHNGGKTQDNGTFFNDIYANSGGDYHKYWEEGKGTEWMINPGDVLRIPDNRPGADLNINNDYTHAKKNAVDMGSSGMKALYDLLNLARGFHLYWDENNVQYKDIPADRYTLDEFITNNEAAEKTTFGQETMSYFGGNVDGIRLGNYSSLLEIQEKTVDVNGFPVTMGLSFVEGQNLMVTMVMEKRYIYIIAKPEDILDHSVTPKIVRITVNNKELFNVFSDYVKHFIDYDTMMSRINQIKK